MHARPPGYHRRMSTPASDSPLPYRIAVLCYLFDDAGRVLLLHRRKPPNADLYSPVGGKLDQSIGESPTQCAIREIEEETQLTVTSRDLHLTGIVSESGYEDQCHWLMFLYELTRPVSIERLQFDEGRLEWHAADAIPELPIPATDRDVIWPLFWQYRGAFFAAHIHCEGGHLQWHLQQPANDVAIASRD